MLMSLFKTLCLLVMSEHCYLELFVKMNFFNVPCLKTIISKGLGLGIVAGSMFVKVPQIMKIMIAKNATGISLSGTALELFALLSSVSYSFVNKYPFSSYGDAVFLLIQTSLICALVLYYGGAKEKAFFFLLAITTVTLFFCSGSLPLSILWSLQASNIPIVFLGKIIQAWLNYKNKSTGQLSAVTITMLFFGSMARIFTSLQETGDPVVVATYSASTTANAVLFSQIFLYWKSSDIKKSKKTR